MILSSLTHLDSLRVLLPAPLQTALDYIKNNDFSKIEPGIYDVQGKDIFAIVQNLTTGPAENMRPEAHRKYVDVQYLWKGREKIGVAKDTGNNKVSEDRLAKDDVMFFHAMENESVLDMRPGHFAVFFPSDIHRPGCQAGAPEEISKVVMKVSLALLNK